MKELCLLLVLVIWGQMLEVRAEAPESLRLLRTMTPIGNSSSSVLLSVPQTSTIMVELDVYVGQIVRVIIPKAFTSISAEQGFPRWLEIQNDSFVGIPDVENVGQTDIKIETAQDGTTVFRFSVNTEETNPCGENMTSWLDTHFHESPTLDNMVKAAELIREVASKLDVKTDTLRVYSNEYGSMNKDLEVIGQDGHNGTFIVSFVASCGDFEEASDIMSDFVDFDNVTTNVTLARGYFKLKPTTPTSTTTLPTTLATTMTSIPEVKKILKAVCTRGKLCKVYIPLLTFGEDDRKVRDGTIGIVTSKQEEHFLYYGNNRHFTGYPMTEGNFTSQITKPRDNAITDYVLLMVQVNAQPDSTHYIQLDMSRPSCSDIIEKPIVRVDLMNQLYYALKGHKNSLMLHEISCVNNVTRVHFSNTTIKADTCDATGIRDFFVKMMTEHLQKTNYVFIQAMNTVATVRKAVLVLSGPCAVLKPLTTSTTTTSIPERETDRNWFTLVIIILLIICLVFASIVMSITCQQRCRNNNPTQRATESEQTNSKQTKHEYTINLDTIQETQEVAETFV